VIYTSLAEDRSGGVYLGTTRGVYFRDPLSASWRVYTAEDGLINDEIAEMHVDRMGALWLTSQRGVARIVPRAQPRRDVPPARIESVSLSGTMVPSPWSRPLDERPVTVEPELARLRVEFAANELLLRPLAYRFRLLGLDDAWTDAGTSRSANFGALSPGRYEFEVVPVALDGGTGAPARFKFEVLRPRWARSGALGAYALLAGAIVIAVRRSRLERNRAIETVRSRIARDLHDDVGSSLTQIALIAEVLRQVPPASESHVRERLGRMTSLARESLDSFRDIIWALNPREGRIEEVTSRLRKMAADLDEGPEVQVAFDDPGVGQIRLRVEPKHHLYLIAKELVHNAVRHAKCNRVDVRVRVVDEEIELSVVDDGVGFAADAASPGFGLSNVKRRAQTIGGRIEIDSQKSRGTRIFVRVPLHSSGLLKRLNRRLAPWV
jgi:signal transduction histidine kinase